MADFPLVTSGGGNRSASTTYYSHVGTAQAVALKTTEDSNVNRQWKNAGTFSKLCVVLSANNRGSSTVRFRVNGANGNQTFSFTGTGLFHDTSNSDTISANDQVCIQEAVGSGGSSHTWQAQAVVFSGDSPRLYAQQQNAVTGNLTYYFPIAGRQSAISTESSAAAVSPRGAGTLRNLAVNPDAFSGTSVVTVSRVNGSDGNMTVTNTATGLVEDTSNSDTISATDTINYKATYTSVTGYLGGPHCEWLPDSTDYPAIHGTEAGAFTISNAIQYWPMVSSANRFTTENSIQTTYDAAVTLSYLYLYVGSASLTGSSTITSRINNADGNMALSSINATGTYEDTSNSDTVAAADRVGLKSTALTSGSARTDLFRVLVTVAASGPTTLSATDSIVVVVSETASLVAIMSSQESLAGVVSEAAALSAFLPTTETIVAELSEQAFLTAFVDVADVTQIAISDLADLVALLDSIDAVVCGLGDTAFALAMLDSPDELSVQIGEVVSLSSILEAQDGVSVGQAEAVGELSALIDAADQVVAQLSSFVDVNATTSASETLAATIDEAVIVFGEMDALESIHVQVDDRASVLGVVVSSESIRAGLDVAVAIDAFSDASDQVAIGVTESTDFVVSVSPEDSVLIGLDESSLVLVALDAIDSIAVAITDYGFVVVGGSGGVVDVVAAESLSIGIDDGSSAVLVSVSESDSVGLALSELIDLFVSADGVESLRVLVAEDHSVVAILACSEDVSAGLGEATDHIRVSVPTSDAVVISGDELVDALSVFALAYDSVGVGIDEPILIEASMDARDDLAIAADEAGHIASLISATELLVIGITDALGVIDATTPSDASTSGGSRGRVFRIGDTSPSVYTPKFRPNRWR